MSNRLFGIVGWKNAGKTTLVERIVGELTARGYRVSTVKHAHHEADVDEPGRDTYRHRAAGATETMLVTAKRWALMHECRDEPEPPLEEIVRHLSPVDLVVVEGFKAYPHQKLEIRAVAATAPLLAATDPNVLAIAADGPVPGTELPVFDRNDVSAIVDFIIATAGLPRRDERARA